MSKRYQKRHRPARLRTWALLLAGVGLLLLSVISAIWLAGAPAQSALANQDIAVVPQVVEFPAPEINLTDLQGRAVSLVEYTGQVVLVNNWATWCPPCKAEMPTLQAYYNQYKDQDFVLIGIEAGEPAAQVSAFVEQYELTFPVWLDPDSQALRAFRNDALPSSYVIDAQGMVRLAWTGAISHEMLEKFVTPLLED
jgi:peroxiredoxin